MRERHLQLIATITEGEPILSNAINCTYCGRDCHHRSAICKYCMSGNRMTPWARSRTNKARLDDEQGMTVDNLINGLRDSQVDEADLINLSEDD